MRKMICIVLLCILCMGLLSGCSKKTDVDTSTVFIEKKDQIVSVDVEVLDKDYYDVAELEEYIADHVDDYTTENGKKVEQISFEVAEQIAKLQMKYAHYEDYSAFNGIELYTGTVEKALAVGYDLDGEFYRVPKDSKKTAELEKADSNDTIDKEDYKVVVIQANVDVCVPGTVLYVSNPSVKIKDKNTVSITGESGQEAELTYIIYK